MAKYYWKGTAAGFTTGVTGASYSAWINATSVGLTTNWAYSIGTIGSGVTGATALPGLNDSIYISDRFPTLGTTLSGTTIGANFTYALSPCLNSSNVGITASYLYLGPWNNQSVSGLPLIDTFGFGRVGGPTLGNAAISETAGVTAQNLVGYQLQCRVTNGIFVYDNDLGAYDINLNVVGTTASTLTVSRIDPTTGGTTFGTLSAFTLAQRPWKSQTALRLDGTARSMIVNSNVVLGTLHMYSNFSLTPTNTGVTATAALKLIGQIFNTELEYSSATGNVGHILVDPNIRCFDASAAGRYVFGGSVLRNGTTQNLSTASSSEYADIILKSARRGLGLTSGTISQYTVVLGTYPTEAEPAAMTSQKFAVLSTSAGQTGSPLVKIRGTVFPADFVMESGRLILDSDSITGQQGFVVGNGYIVSSQGADFGGLVRLNPYSSNLVEASGVAALRHNGSGYYGLRTNGVGNIRYPLNATIETHVDSPYMY